MTKDTLSTTYIIAAYEIASNNDKSSFFSKLTNLLERSPNIFTTNSDLIRASLQINKNILDTPFANDALIFSLATNLGTIIKQQPDLVDDDLIERMAVFDCTYDLTRYKYEVYSNAIIRLDREPQLKFDQVKKDFAMDSTGFLSRRNNRISQYEKEASNACALFPKATLKTVSHALDNLSLAS